MIDHHAAITINRLQSDRRATSSRGLRTNAVSAALRIGALSVAALGLVVAHASAGKEAAPGGACDGLDKASAAWAACAAKHAALSDAELFYAGYWMAQTGRYDEAIGYLKQARSPDARTLTYLGFATRKSGDVDAALGYYRQALAMAPDYVVARAYLGEAHIARGDLTSARTELGEIARRCGVNCAAYDELARHVAKASPANG
ncbi:MAG: tetratricopeptide repeat protein [Hyphomicrobiaceae bacterium]|nr:tetratricopeptide repeat protein [Hyphomicrobiaceae bacterium]